MCVSLCDRVWISIVVALVVGFCEQNPFTHACLSSQIVRTLAIAALSLPLSFLSQNPFEIRTLEHARGEERMLSERFLAQQSSLTNRNRFDTTRTNNEITAFLSEIQRCSGFSVSHSVSEAIIHTRTQRPRRTKTERMCGVSDVWD